MKWTQKLVWTGFALQEDMPFNSAAVGDCHSDGLAPIPCEVIPRAAPSLTEIDIATDPCNDRSGLTTENEMHRGCLFNQRNGQLPELRRLSVGWQVSDQLGDL